MRVTYIRWSRFCTVHFCLKSKIILGISLIFISSATTCLPTGCTLQSHQCSGCFHHETWLVQIIPLWRESIRRDMGNRAGLFCSGFLHTSLPHVSPSPCAHTHPMATITCRHTLPGCFSIYFSGCFPFGARRAGGAFDWNSLLKVEAPPLIVPAWEKLSSVTIFSSVKWHDTNASLWKRRGDSAKQHIALGRTVHSGKWTQPCIIDLVVIWRAGQSHSQHIRDSPISGLVWTKLLL